MRMPRTIGLSLALLVVSAPAIAKEVQTGHHHQQPSVKSKPARSEAAVTKGHAKRRRVARKVGPRAKVRHDEQARRHIASLRHGVPAHRHEAALRRGEEADEAALPPPDQYIGPLRVIGQREVGGAAWYGGRHVGRRTASGERLDMVHVTAAHRSLPLNSLVRVTNLRNGRSVVATINDRGPVSHSLLIDLSPKAAEELHMMRAGIVTVAIDPVAPERAQPR